MRSGQVAQGAEYAPPPCADCDPPVCVAPSKSTALISIPSMLTHDTFQGKSTLLEMLNYTVNISR